jgi:hypothetical protein
LIDCTAFEFQATSAIFHQALPNNQVACEYGSTLFTTFETSQATSQTLLNAPPIFEVAHAIFAHHLATFLTSQPHQDTKEAKSETTPTGSSYKVFNKASSLQYLPLIISPTASAV